MSWLGGLLEVARGLSRVADACERIANVLEGHPPVVDLKEAPPDSPYDVAARDDQEMLRLDLVERTLTPILGRRPTPDELVAALDQVEWTAGDAADHVRRVRESARGPH